ncbi:MAG: restriction endonuclease subunit S [Elusimicrobiaceae bacterium]|nr:restriction endonuclease subunit S [Elusimicrobiaceae bacterium]
MNLDTTNWKEFSLNKLFIIKKGKRLTSEDQEDGVYNYIGAIDSNNGIANHIAQQPIHEGNTISLSYNGSVGEAFYQKDPYWATDDVNALYSRYDGFNEPIGLFIATVIRAEKYKFSYGRKWTLENMQKSIIKLPVRRSSDGKPFIDKMHMYSDEGYVPDWQFMEQYVRSLHHKPLTTKNRHANAVKLNIADWKEFRIGDVFPKTVIKHFSAIPEIEGMIPFVSSTSNNNGIASFVDADVVAGNCITVSTNGDCFDCFYQPDAIAVSNDVEVLYTPMLNQYNALFIITVMSLEKKKYGYGRKPKNDRVYDTIIRLPSNKNGQPDWQFMEDYIKSLPYGDRL